MAGVSISAADARTLGEIIELCAGPTTPEPLPWPLMERIAGLVPSDGLTFCGLDSAACGSYLVQELGEDAQPVLEVHDVPTCAPAEEPFWQHYWSSCAYPELSRDFASVTKLSDFVSQREWWQQPMRVDYLTTVRWDMMLALDDGGPRTVRLLCFRESGRDFSERERFLLTLLRPHLEQRYRAWQAARAEADDARGARRLTARQLELIGLLEEGLTNRQIARRLGVSEGTVRTHLVNAYQRLGVTNRTAAVMQVLDARTTVPQWRRRTERLEIA